MRIALAIAFLAVHAPANAQSVSIGPDPCPALADLDPLAPLAASDAFAEDLNRWAFVGHELLLFKNVPVADGEAIIRVFPDPITGEALPAPLPLDECPLAQPGPETGAAPR